MHFVNCHRNLIESNSLESADQVQQSGWAWVVSRSWLRELLRREGNVLNEVNMEVAPRFRTSARQLPSTKRQNSSFAVAESMRFNGPEGALVAELNDTHLLDGVADCFLCGHYILTQRAPQFYPRSSRLSRMCRRLPCSRLRCRPVPLGS